MRKHSGVLSEMLGVEFGLTLRGWRADEPTVDVGSSKVKRALSGRAATSQILIHRTTFALFPVGREGEGQFVGVSVSRSYLMILVLRRPARP